ncbi:MAG: outer membrane lipoprotein carrier protein LolA [Minicystis sp.]
MSFLHVPRRHFLAALGAAGATLALPRFARADEVSVALAEIAKARASLKTLVASFTQERTIGLLATVVKSEGELTLVRPDRLRWELKPPDGITYWITPEGFGYASSSGSASVGKDAAKRFGAVLSDLGTFLGGDLELLRKRYDLSASSTSEGLELVAHPLADDVKKHVKQVELSVAAERWSMRRVTIAENNGDKSVITFGKVARDVKVDPAKMELPKKS